MLHGETGVASLLVLSRRDGRCQGPEDHQDGEGGQESEEDGGVEATVELAGNPPRHCYEKGKEKIVVEGVAARSICRERCIFDGRELDCSQLLVNIRGWERAKRYAQKWCGHHNPRWEFAGVAVGVSMNSKSSEDSECVLAMMNDCMRSYNLRTGWQAFCIKVRNKWCYFSYERKWRWSNQLRDQVAGESGRNKSGAQ